MREGEHSDTRAVQDTGKGLTGCGRRGDLRGGIHTHMHKHILRIRTHMATCACLRVWTVCVRACVCEPCVTVCIGWL